MDYYSESEHSDYDISDEEYVEVDDFADEEADFDVEDDFLINSDKVLKPPPQKFNEWSTVPPGDKISNFEFRPEVMELQMEDRSESGYFKLFFNMQIIRL